MKKKKELHDDVETMVQQFGLAAHIAVVMIETGELSFDA